VVQEVQEVPDVVLVVVLVEALDSDFFLERMMDTIPFVAQTA
jgi:hypothetical protein